MWPAPTCYTQVILSALRQGGTVLLFKTRIANFFADICITKNRNGNFHRFCFFITSLLASDFGIALKKQCQRTGAYVRAGNGLML